VETVFLCFHILKLKIAITYKSYVPNVETGSRDSYYNDSTHQDSLKRVSNSILSSTILMVSNIQLVALNNFDTPKVSYC